MDENTRETAGGGLGEDAEAFEAFLREFRPSRPRPLPVQRRAAGLVPFAAAAAVLIGVAVAGLIWWPGGGEAPAPVASDAAQAGTAGHTGDGQDRGDQPGAEGPSTDASQGSPTLEFRPSAGDQFSGPVEPIAGYVDRFRVGRGFRPPRKVYDVSPTYPQDARLAGVQGVVILDVVIGKDGTVIELEVERSVSLLDQAAIDAVRQWRFEVSQLNGEPIEVAMIVTVNFQLG